MTDAWIVAHWPAPAHIHAITSTRPGGHSREAYASFNLARHVGDDASAVNANRQQLKQSLNLLAEPRWLTQIHGCRVQSAHEPDSHPADASWTDRPGVVCAVLTADCLPLLLCDRAGSCVAAVHVGWRGLVAGVVEAAVAALPAEPADILAWLGPAIGPRAFEVGPDVLAACREAIDQTESCFTPIQTGHWHADLPRLVTLALHQAGVDSVYKSGLCTYSDTEHFYSYRRDGVTGRMASLIWMDECPG